MALHYSIYNFSKPLLVTVVSDFPGHMYSLRKLGESMKGGKERSQNTRTRRKGVGTRELIVKLPFGGVVVVVIFVVVVVVVSSTGLGLWIVCT